MVNDEGAIGFGRRPSARIAVWAACLLLLAGSSHAQSTTHPIPISAPVASWAIELADVVQIPDSDSSPPRLEQVVYSDVTGLAYVIDQRGPIYSFDPAAATPTPNVFLDLSTAVADFYFGFEAGVRSIAFHPDIDDPAAAGYRKLYVTLSRTASSLPVGGPAEFDSPSTIQHQTILSEWTLLPNGAVDLGSYREVMRVGQPFGNHNSGHLGFDPTKTPGHPDYGLLFVSLGDGGGGGDPFDVGQDIDATPVPYPHGKILRIDPLAAGGSAYSVPTNNPFAGTPDRLAEIWAYGFRNPHKFNWDRLTGRLYVSDIGQGVVEELSIVRRGGNYGWRDREGAFTYVSTTTVSPLPPTHPTDDYRYPVAQYDQFSDGLTGNAAIVGGPIYRGAALPALSGSLLFADFANSPGPIFAVHVNDLVEREDLTAIASFDDGRLAPYQEVLIRDGGVDKSFRTFLRDATGNAGLGRTDLRWGEGPGGEIFVLNKQDGWVRQIVAVPGHPGPPQLVPGLTSPGMFILAVSLVIVAFGTLAANRRRV